ncbi:MAG: glutaredoxin family protein [Acidiferrobacterales bacterium]
MGRPVLTLYMRHDCHLCEEMRIELVRLQACLEFELRLVDIDQDPRLVERFKHKVPVLAHGDHEICYYFLEEEALRERLARTR